jgi:mannosyltransferase
MRRPYLFTVGTLGAVVGTREPRDVESAGIDGGDSFYDECRRVWRDPHLPHRRWLLGLGTVVVSVGVVLRFYCPSALWLDEAISVNISKLSLIQIPGALSHDGAPPLYYVLLHFWMLVFGRGDFAVRALSGVTSVATLPFFWHAGRRVGGRVGGWVLFFLAVASPFAIDYATATRMYSLMILLSLLGFLALEHALEAPTRRHLISLGVVTAAILYTHYWGLYLVAATGAWLVYRMWRERRDGPDVLAVRPAFGAVVIGSLCFLPWSPVFVFQTLHTGTPWTGAAGPADILGVFGDFAGSGPWGTLLGFLFVLLVVLGLFGRSAAAQVGFASPATDGAPAPLLQMVGRPNPRVASLTAIMVATLVLAVVAGAIADAAFVARYAAVIFPLFLILVAVGVTMLTRGRIIVAILVVTSLAGLLTGFNENSEQRTQAVQVAQILNAEAQPGDLVVYCPDQLGPAVDRLLTVPGVTELTYPRAIGPSRVDWVDYRKTLAETNVATFAQQMLGQLGADHTLWVVERDGYPGLGGSCGALVSWFNLLKPTGETLVHADGAKYYEYENLLRYPS